MNPDHWTLTKDRYFELVDIYTTKLNISLKERYLMGAKKKGETVDLSARDFDREQNEEGVDWIAYGIMRSEYLSRAKELL